MITLVEVKTQIGECIENRRHAEKPGEISKLKKRHGFLKLIHDYLLESPSADYIKFTKKRLEHNLEVVNTRFQEKLSEAGRNEGSIAKSVLSEIKKKFEKEYDVKKTKEQLKAINSS